jgi:hypothetical protein
MAMKAAARDQSERTQRVRAGATGLAAVLIIAGLAGAIFNTTASDEPESELEAQITQVTGNTATAVEKEVNEPLAELGVAPASEPEGNKTSPVAN